MNDLITTKDELGFHTPEAPQTDLMQVSEARAVAEVQAQYVIAKKFPRNAHAAYIKIIDACKRPHFAEQAMYAYPRGGSLVTGPSIRLAEVMARSWGNIDFGIREISQNNGVSTVEAYAIDLETNTPSRIVFHVPHVRDTKKGRQKLTDARDIYEMVANQGARRLRACILKLMEPDIVEAAIEQIKKTLQSGEVPISEQVKKMVVAFDELGVKVEHLEKRLGHNLDATIAQEIVTLKAIYRSLKDGFSKREDYFDISDGTNKSDVADNLQSLLADKAKHKKDEVKHEKRSDDTGRAS